MGITLTVTGENAAEFHMQFSGLVSMFTDARASSWAETPEQHALEQKTAAELVASKSVVTSATETAAPEAPAVEQPKRTRRTKAELEAARAAEAAAQTTELAEKLENEAGEALPETIAPPAEQTAPLDGELLPPEPKEATEQDLRNALMKVSAEDKLGAEKAFGLLQAKGFGKVSDVPADRRAEIIADAAALLRSVDLVEA